MRDVELTQDEEVSLGKEISARVRARYGVVQDPEIHKYVSLVGNVLTRQTPQTGMAWQFIVLDTDGVNAFAAPGGFVHLTRGALALMKSEAELAGVLSHELAHVTMKHTVRAIQKNKLVQMGVNDANVKSNQDLFKRLADEGTRVVMSGFGRAEELEADGEGIATTDKAGYSPSSLKAFLTTIKLRNGQSNERQGFFSSHLELEERLQKIDARIELEKWTTSVRLEDRYSSNVKYNSVALAKIGTVESKTEALPAARRKRKRNPLSPRVASVWASSRTPWVVDRKQLRAPRSPVLAVHEVWMSNGRPKVEAIQTRSRSLSPRMTSLLSSARGSCDPNRREQAIDCRTDRPLGN